MQIREMKKEDIKDCVDLSHRARKKSWEKYEKEVYPQKLFEEELKRYSNETFTRFIDNKSCYGFVAYEKHGILGLTIGRFQEGGLSDLAWICTDPLVQKKGVGKKLLSDVMEYSRKKGCHKIFAYTFPFLIPAITFYLKSGFVLEAYLKKHWYGMDFVIMSKWLK